MFKNQGQWTLRTPFEEEFDVANFVSSAKAFIKNQHKSLLKSLLPESKLNENEEANIWRALNFFTGGVAKDLFTDSVIEK